MLPWTKYIRRPSLRKDTNLEQKTLDNSIQFQRLFNSNFFVYSSLSDVLSKFILFVQQEIIISIPLTLSLNRLNLENKSSNSKKKFMYLNVDESQVLSYS